MMGRGFKKDRFWRKLVKEMLFDKYLILRGTVGKGLQNLVKRIKEQSLVEK